MSNIILKLQTYISDIAKDIYNKFTGVNYQRLKLTDTTIIPRTWQILAGHDHNSKYGNIFTQR